MANVDDASSLRRTSVIKAALAGRESLQVVALQVIGDEVVEPVFGLVRRELLEEREARVIRHVGRHLPTQSAMAEGLQAPCRRCEHLSCVEIGELLAEALEVAEDVFVDEADQAEQLEKRVLERRCGQQQFRRRRQRPFSVLAMTLEGL